MSTLKTNSVEPINNSTDFTIKSGVGSPTRITATTAGDVNIGSAAAPIDSLAVHSTTAHSASNAVLEVTNGNTNIAAGVNLANFMASGDPINYNPRLIITANNSGIILNETYTSTANNLMFQIGNVEKMRLNSTGLGVLNANPGKALDVTGEIRASGDITTTGGNITATGSITATSGGLSAAAGLTVGGRTTLTGAVSLGSSLVVANGTTLGSTNATGAVLHVRHTGSPTDTLGSSVYVSANTAGTYNALTLQNGNNTSGAAEVVFQMPVFNNTSGLNIRQSSSAQGPSWAGSGYDAIIRTGQSSSKLHFAGGNNAGPFLTVDTAGVGIGTVTPGASLDVNGTLRVNGISGVLNVNEISGFTASGGIRFPTTAVNSSDANTLDDYEEGTWTPSLTFNSGNPTTITYNTAAGAYARSGVYVKIGRLVWCHGRIQLSALTGAAAGPVRITGFPFAASYPTSVHPVGIVSYYSGLATATITTAPTLYFDATDPPTVRLSKNGAGATTSMANTDFTANTDIIFSIVYGT